MFINIIIHIIIIAVVAVVVAAGYVSARNHGRRLLTAYQFPVSVSCTVMEVWPETENAQHACTCAARNSITDRLYRRFIMSQVDYKKEAQLKNAIDAGIHGRLDVNTGCNLGVFQQRDCGTSQFGVKCGGETYAVVSDVKYGSFKNLYGVNDRILLYTDTLTKSRLMADQPFKVRYHTLEIVKSGAGVLLVVLVAVLALVARAALAKTTAGISGR
jgi:hypothetical protein